MSVLGFLLLLALIPAFIAKSKKRSFILWYVYGFFLLPIALIHVLIVGRRAPPASSRKVAQPEPEEGVVAARSALGEMRFNGREVTITRASRTSNTLIHGLDGEKSIAISAIQAVQFKAATGSVRGYIQLTIAGGFESRGGVIAAAGDENSMLFDLGDQWAFQELADAIKAAVYERSIPNRAAPLSAADELAKFAKLRDEGLLNEEEFAAKKKQLLGPA